jgi:glucose-1-phosphate cytidylyltransferase
MNVIILAGGYGTRLSEETSDKPKPMVLLDDKPILWHIMNGYASQGFSDFTVAAGYKAEIIIKWSKKLSNDWNIDVINTGLDTQTGGRIKRCMSERTESEFFVTYGDGLANVNLKKLLDYHRNNGRKATVTAVRPPARFGVLELDSGLVSHFGEKNQTDSGWINGGFFVLEKSVSEYIDNDSDSFEFNTLPKLVSDRELAAYQHEGFWQPMDTLRERNLLADYLKKSGIPPWLDFLR